MIWCFFVILTMVSSMGVKELLTHFTPEYPISVLQEQIENYNSFYKENGMKLIKVMNGTLISKGFAEKIEREQNSSVEIVPVFTFTPTAGMGMAIIPIAGETKDVQKKYLYIDIVSANNSDKKIRVIFSTPNKQDLYNAGELKISQNVSVMGKVVAVTPTMLILEKGQLIN